MKFINVNPSNATICDFCFSFAIVRAPTSPYIIHLCVLFIYLCASCEYINILRVQLKLIFLSSCIAPNAHAPSKFRIKCERKGPHQHNRPNEQQKQQQQQRKNASDESCYCTAFINAIKPSLLTIRARCVADIINIRRQTQTHTTIIINCMVTSCVYFYISLCPSPARSRSLSSFCFVLLLVCLRSLFSLR